MTGRADVVIVGAGPSGAVAAKRFHEAGMKVTVLEQGQWPNYEHARAGERDYEITADRYWVWDPNGRNDPSDYPIDESDSDITALMWNGVGGSSILYAAHWERFLPSDFAVRTLDGVADDWPFAYEDLAPFYDRVEYDFAVSGLAGDPIYPEGHAPPLPPLPINKVGVRVGEAANRLGWHWWPASNAIASVKHENLNPCVQRTACVHGCPTAAKASVDRTHWMPLVKAGVDLKTGARASQVLTSSAGLATGVEWIDLDGKRHVEEGDVVVICANGIGTPRLLLMSESRKHRNGIANSSGLVGKRLMMHPFVTTVGLVEEDLESWRGAYGAQVHVMEFYETKPERGFVRGSKWGIMPTGSPLSLVLPGLWDDGDEIWGTNFHDTIRKRFGRSIFIGAVCEDLPEESNRVVLSDRDVDSSGLPAAKVMYETSANSRAIAEFQMARSRELLEEMGAYDIESSITPYSGWHLLGTTKMGTDPDDSVVDQWGQTHDVANLFVYDGSTFPTSSGVNPTGTIAANALRFAEHLVETRFDVRVAS